MFTRIALGMVVMAVLLSMPAFKHVEPRIGGNGESTNLNCYDRVGDDCPEGGADGHEPLQRPLPRHPGMPTNQVLSSAQDDPRISAPLAACFDPDTSLEYVEQIQAMAAVINSANAPNHDEAAPRYEFDDGDRWSGGLGNPRALTWSLVPDGLSISNGIGEGTANSELFSRMDSLFASQGGRATWIARIQACFDRWHQVAGVTYTRVTFNGNDWDDGASWGTSGSAGLRGDVRICMKNLDGQSGVLAYNYYPSSGDMVLDRSENWSSSSNQNRFFRNVLMHEHGHGLGFAHVCPADGKILMEPFLSSSYDGVRQDDIRAGQRAYGDPHENNDTSATAFDLGTVVSGTPLTNTCTLPNPPTGSSDANCSTCSLDDDNDVDFYRFNVTGSATATITVTPVGSTYLSNPQNSQCSGGSSVNSLAIANLNLQVLGTNGSTVLATAASNPSGSAESLTNVALTGSPGTFYIRVYPGDAPSQSQLYTLSVSVTGGQTPPSCATCRGDVNGDSIVDGRDVNGWVACFTSGSGAGYACADMNGSGVVSTTDQAMLIAKLLTDSGPCP